MPAIRSSIGPSRSFRSRVDSSMYSARMIRIEPLSTENLFEAGKKADAIFTDEPETASFWYEQSLGIDVKPEYWEKDGGATTIRYWIGRDDATGDVVGGTGLYTMPGDEAEAAWLGWYWVDPARRGEGLGRMLLQFAIDTARAEGKSYLRLYTSDSPSEKVAGALYEKMGFVETGRKPREDGLELIYKQLSLK